MGISVPRDTWPHMSAQLPPHLQQAMNTAPSGLGHTEWVIVDDLMFDNLRICYDMFEDLLDNTRLRYAEPVKVRLGHTDEQRGIRVSVTFDAERVLDDQLNGEELADRLAALNMGH